MKCALWQMFQFFFSPLILESLKYIIMLIFYPPFYFFWSSPCWQLIAHCSSGSYVISMVLVLQLLFQWSFELQQHIGGVKYISQKERKLFLWFFRWFSNLSLLSCFVNLFASLHCTCYYYYFILFSFPKQIKRKRLNCLFSHQ